MRRFTELRVWQRAHALPRVPEAVLPVACPVCGAQSARRAFSGTDLLVGVPGTFQYLRCETCSTVYQSPRVRDEDLLLCYPSDYFTHVCVPSPPQVQRDATRALRSRLRRAVLAAGSREPPKDLAIWWTLLGRVLSLVPPIRRRARFGLIDELAPPTVDHPACLEVGPGRGDTLLRLRQVGWLAVGLDIDPAAAAIASSYSGCDVRVGKLAGAAFPPGSFHLIYLHHTLEHLPDPEPSLSRCFELLAATGRLVVVYPNPEALTVRAYGEFSCVWDPPRHLVLPAPGAIRQLLRRLGFRIVQCRTSAGRAGVYHKASRNRWAGRSQQSFDATPLTFSDRLFSMSEAALVAAGIPVGEEILVVAEKP